MSQQTQPFAPLSEQEERAIRTLYRAFSDKNPDLLDEAVTPAWQDIPLGPGQVPGPQGFKPVMQAFFAAFPDINVTIHEIIGVAGRAGVRAEITGTHSGEWMGVAPTGKFIRIPIHEFHHLKDGKITHTYHMEDWLGWFAQVGAGPNSKNG